MSKSLYKETFDSVKVSEEALTKALETAKNFKEVKVMKKRKTIKFKATAVIAASLAFVIALGAIFFNSGIISNTDSFTLKAYAAEITDDTYVAIGNFSRQGGGSSYDINGNVISNITAEGCFDFFVNCEGENIETITYTANNSSFLLNSEYEGFVDTKLLEDDLYSTHLNGRYSYSSYTVDYNKQPDPELYENAETNKKYYGSQEDIANAFGEDYDTFAPVILSLSAEIEEEIEVNSNESEDLLQTSGAIDKMLYEKINKESDNYTIDIKVTYTDGHTECKTIQLGCEENPDSSIGYNLTAKIRR